MHSVFLRKRFRLTSFFFKISENLGRRPKFTWNTVWRIFRKPGFTNGECVKFFKRIFHNWTLLMIFHKLKKLFAIQFVLHLWDIFCPSVLWPFKARSLKILNNERVYFWQILCFFMHKVPFELLKIWNTDILDLL